MYPVLKNHLENGAFTLEDAMRRIDYAVARGSITPDQAQELSRLASQNAAGATLEDRVTELEQELQGLVRTEIVPSDKEGSSWRNTYVKNVLVMQEYIPNGEVV